MYSKLPLLLVHCVLPVLRSMLASTIFVFARIFACSRGFLRIVQCKYSWKLYLVLEILYIVPGIIYIVLDYFKYIVLEILYIVQD